MFSLLIEKLKVIKEQCLVAIILFAALILRLINIGRPFDVDEYKTFVTSSLNFNEMFQRLLIDSHPPLYNIFLRFWLFIAQSEIWMRLPSVIAGVITIYFLYRLAKISFGKKVALTALGLSAILPQAVWSSQYIRSYSLAALFAVIGVYYFALIFIKGKDTAKTWAMMIAFLLLSIYTFYFFIFIIISLNIFALFYLKKGFMFFRKWIISQLILFFAFLPGIYFFILQAGYFLRHPLESAQVGYYIGNLHLGVMLRSLLGVWGIDHLFLFKTPVSELLSPNNLITLSISFSAIFILLLVYLARDLFSHTTGSREKMMNLLCLHLAFLPFLLAMTANIATNVVVAQRYFYLSSLFFYLTVAYWIIKTKRKTIKFLFPALIVLIFSFRLFAIWDNKGADFRTMGEYLQITAQEQGIVIFVPFYGIEKHYLKNVDYAMLNIESYIREERGSLSVSENLLNNLYGYKDIYYFYHRTSLHHRKQNKVVKSWLLEQGFVPGRKIDFGDLALLAYKMKEKSDIR